MHRQKCRAGIDQDAHSIVVNSSNFVGTGTIFQKWTEPNYEKVGIHGTTHNFLYQCLLGSRVGDGLGVGLGVGEVGHISDKNLMHDESIQVTLPPVNTPYPQILIFFPQSKSRIEMFPFLHRTVYCIPLLTFILMFIGVRYIEEQEYPSSKEELCTSRSDILSCKSTRRKNKKNTGHTRLIPRSFKHQ